MKPREASLSHETLTELLDYNPETGVFTWKVNRGSVRAGDEAGIVDNWGYVRFRLCDRLFMAHRLAWFYTHATWPEADIDHIDGDRANNRLANLRPTTRSENCRNQKKRSSNSTGFKGVYKHSKCDKYVAQIVTDGKNTYLGLFETPEEAYAAYIKASKEHHQEFGRVA